MRLKLGIVFLFLTIFTYAGVPSDNIVKVRVIVNSIEYISYVVISSKEYLNIFTIIKESL